MITEKAFKRAILVLFRDFSSTHTITSLAKQLGMSRVGVWKILKQLQSEQLIKLTHAGDGKTSTSIASINWENILAEKSISLYVSEDALKQRRWRLNFAELEGVAEFIILFGSVLHFPKEAKDVDICVVAKKGKFIKIQKVIDKIQKTEIKKIHAVNFSEKEFKDELKNGNKALLDAIDKGVILYGQEKFVKFVKGLQKDEH